MPDYQKIADDSQGQLDAQGEALSLILTRLAEQVEGLLTDQGEALGEVTKRAYSAVNRRLGSNQSQLRRVLNDGGALIDSRLGEQQVTLNTLQGITERPEITTRASAQVATSPGVPTQTQGATDATPTPPTPETGLLSQGMETGSQPALVQDQPTGQTTGETAGQIIGSLLGDAVPPPPSTYIPPDWQHFTGVNGTPYGVPPWCVNNSCWDPDAGSYDTDGCRQYRLDCLASGPISGVSTPTGGGQVMQGIILPPPPPPVMQGIGQPPPCPQPCPPPAINLAPVIQLPGIGQMVQMLAQSLNAITMTVNALVAAVGQLGAQRVPPVIIQPCPPCPPVNVNVGGGGGTTITTNIGGTTIQSSVSSQEITTIQTQETQQIQSNVTLNIGSVIQTIDQSQTYNTLIQTQLTNITTEQIQQNTLFDNREWIDNRQINTSNFATFIDSHDVINNTTIINPPKDPEKWKCPQDVKPQDLDKECKPPDKKCYDKDGKEIPCDEVKEPPPGPVFPVDLDQPGAFYLDGIADKWRGHYLGFLGVDYLTNLSSLASWVAQRPTLGEGR